MRVAYHSKFKNHGTAECTSVTVFDDQGYPLSVTIKIADGVYQTTHAGEKNFKQVLQSMGITKTLEFSAAQ